MIAIKKRLVKYTNQADSNADKDDPDGNVVDAGTIAAGSPHLARQLRHRLVVVGRLKT